MAASRPVGTVHLLDGLWRALGVDAALRKVLGSRRFTTDVERLLFALDFSGGNPGCRVQRAVAGTLDDFLHDAEALLAARLSRTTLADVAAQVGCMGHGTETGG